MDKLLQNRVARSKLALPITAAYAAVIWLLCGTITEGWWFQFACFAVTTYLMMELNNIHALIRIYSRMVSTCFLILSCCACFLFSSQRGAFVQLCMVSALLILFTSYQNRQSTGGIYYAFLCIGLASLVFPHIVFFIPLLWLLMGTNLLSLSWHTWVASLLGTLTPYWFGICYLFYTDQLPLFMAHFAPIADVQNPASHELWSPSQQLTAGFAALLTCIGIIHQFRTSYNDKIRTRMFFACFIWIDLAAFVFLIIQPQHYDSLMRLIIICTAPLTGHYLALTSTKFSNIIFIALALMALLLTIFNLVWSTSSLF